MAKKSSEPIFDQALRTIESLTGRIHEATLVIPNFQRNFTWEPRRTKDLLRSIMSRFPAGTLLCWNTGGIESSLLGWRVVEGAPESPKGNKPQEYILDGQQRLTCLYRTLYGAGEERFYMRLKEFWSGNAQAVLSTSDVSFDEALFWIDNDARNSAWHQSKENQWNNDFFPLAEYEDFEEWLDGYIKHRSDLVDPDTTKKVLRGIKATFLTELENYQFPVIYLPASTSLEALCNVFETLNTTAKPLGVFELLTARFYPRGLYLRDMWDEAKENHSLLA